MTSPSGESPHRRRVHAAVATALVLPALFGCAAPAGDASTDVPDVPVSAEDSPADIDPAGAEPEGEPGDDLSMSAGALEGPEAGELSEGTLALSRTDHPAIGRLQPALRDAITRAAADAAAAGVEMWLTSGWRSEAYQQRLLDGAIDRYGNEAEALRRVARPKTSAHVLGAAVDIGPTAADDWLIRKGARYGLCQAYSNEMWHFELLVRPGGKCPAPLADASELGR